MERPNGYATIEVVEHDAVCARLDRNVWTVADTNCVRTLEHVVAPVVGPVVVGAELECGIFCGLLLDNPEVAESAVLVRSHVDVGVPVFIQADEAY